MPGGVRLGDPQTSHDAAVNVATLPLAAMYLAALWRLGPLTTTEIARHWDIPRDSMSPRTPALLQKGLITCVGRRPCRNPSGRMTSMNVYDLTPAGRAAVREALDRARLRA